MRARPNPLVVVIAALLAAALALWGGTALPWPDPGAPAWPGSVALLALAGIAGVVAAAGVARRLVGGLLAVGGVAALVAAVPGFAAAPAGSAALVAGGLLLGGAGGFVAVQEPRLRRLGERYARSGDAAPPADPDRAAWEALDEGSDPTRTDAEPCPHCGAVRELVFVGGEGTPHGVDGHAFTARTVRVLVCGCGGEVQVADHDCFAAPPTGDEDADMVFAAALDTGDVRRLRTGLAACPDPVAAGCGCAAHATLTGSASGGTRIDGPGGRPSALPHRAVVAGADGTSRFAAPTDPTSGSDGRPEGGGPGWVELA